MCPGPRAGTFAPDFYERYRPYYPADTFRALIDALSALSAPVVADIGCGTGHSTTSFISAHSSGHASGPVIGIDPDPAMLEAAKRREPRASFQLGTGEDTGLASLSTDAILVGSALHWMDAQASEAEFSRILKPGGVVLAFEYQFPKALGLPALNEWIRRRFNHDWKAPAQAPRGDFAQVTRAFRQSSRWQKLAEAGPKQTRMILPLGPHDLVGMIRSQSRVLHFERTLSPAELTAFCQELEHAVQTAMPTAHDFDFALAWSLFRLTSA